MHTTERNANPYNARPYNEENQIRSPLGSRLASLESAQSAASALARLLRNDAQLRDLWTDSALEAAKVEGREVEEQEPFNGFMRSGLFAALDLVIDQIGAHVEGLIEQELWMIKATADAKSKAGGK